jgi:uncharacterized protein
VAVEIEYDPRKRASNLEKHQLDFNDAPEVFAGDTATAEDTREDHGEIRYVTAGHLHGRMVVIVWTLRGRARRPRSVIT